MKFHQNYFIVVQSSGDLYVIDPISGELTVLFENMLGELSLIDLNNKESLLVSVSEMGKAQVFKIESKLPEFNESAKSV